MIMQNNKIKNWLIPTISLNNIEHNNASENQVLTYENGNVTWKTQTNNNSNELFKLNYPLQDNFNNYIYYKFNEWEHRTNHLLVRGSSLSWEIIFWLWKDDFNIQNLKLVYYNSPINVNTASLILDNIYYIHCGNVFGDFVKSILLQRNTYYDYWEAINTTTAFNENYFRSRKLILCKEHIIDNQNKIYEWLLTVTSTKLIKHNILPLKENNLLDKLMKLEVKQYGLKTGEKYDTYDKKINLGLVVEETNEI